MQDFVLRDLMIVEMAKLQIEIVTLRRALRLVDGMDQKLEDLDLDSPSVLRAANELRKKWGLPQMAS
jgi:hypothetical protein